MYNLIRAVKHSDTPAASARTCVIIGDNFVENKCNTDYDFCHTLVEQGWYDEIILAYGYTSRLARQRDTVPCECNVCYLSRIHRPVGHTHNG